MTKLEAGDYAPDFALPVEGQTRLAHLRGRNFVLYFYPKDDTPGCTAETIDFNRLRKDFEAVNTTVIGISPDSQKSHAKFQAKYDIALPLVADESRSVLEAYGVWAEKSMWGRKYMGVERATFLVGDDGRVSRVWRKVKVKGHARDVLEAARGLSTVTAS